MPTHKLDNVTSTQQSVFLLQSIKDKIDKRVKLFFDEELQSIPHEYGSNSLVAIRALASITSRGGKRLRGAFVYQSYKMFGRESDTGKSSLDDLKEGKMTLLIVKALESASPKQRLKIQSNLGNQDLDRDSLDEVKEIIRKTGALDYSLEKVSTLTNKAIDIINKQKHWPQTEKQFFMDIIRLAGEGSH